MQVPSAITMIAPEPSMLPTLVMDSGSSVRFSTSAGVRMGVELPPGITAFKALPPRMPPASSKISLRSG